MEAFEQRIGLATAQSQTIVISIKLYAQIGLICVREAERVPEPGTICCRDFRSLDAHFKSITPFNRTKMKLRIKSGKSKIYIFRVYMPKTKQSEQNKIDKWTENNSACSRTVYGQFACIMHSNYIIDYNASFPYFRADRGCRYSFSIIY